MEVNLMDINSIYKKIEIPLRPHITEGQEPVTEEEIERRMKVAEELGSLGISISKFDSEDWHEDKDVLQAIILANQGKRIPEDLRKRILDKKEMEQKERYAKNKLKLHLSSRTGRAYLK